MADSANTSLNSFTDCGVLVLVITPVLKRSWRIR